MCDYNNDFLTFLLERFKIERQKYESFVGLVECKRA